MGTPYGSLEELFSDEEGTEGTGGGRGGGTTGHRDGTTDHLLVVRRSRAILHDGPGRLERRTARHRWSRMTDSSRGVVRDGHVLIGGHSGASSSRPLTGSLVAIGFAYSLVLSGLFVALLMQHGAVLIVDGQLIGTVSPPRSLSRAATRCRCACNNLTGEAKPAMRRRSPLMNRRVSTTSRSARSQRASEGAPGAMCSQDPLARSSSSPSTTKLSRPERTWTT